MKQFFKDYLFEGIHEGVNGIMFECVPVHAREVSPKVTSPVSRTDFYSVNKNWITLKKKWHNDDKTTCIIYCSLIDIFSGKQNTNYLKESANIGLILGTHENNVLKQPEKRAVVAFLGPQHG